MNTDLLIQCMSSIVNNADVKVRNVQLWLGSTEVENRYMWSIGCFFYQCLLEKEADTDVIWNAIPCKLSCILMAGWRACLFELLCVHWTLPVRYAWFTQHCSLFAYRVYVLIGWFHVETPTQCSAVCAGVFIKATQCRLVRKTLLTTSISFMWMLKTTVVTLGEKSK